jgi:threonine dehydrogenase-like Zn-dependent dehydrogenase
VAIFAQGPVGLCATAAARARGAGLVIGVEGVPERAALALRLGANHVVSPDDAVEAIMELTDGRGVDVAIEAVGRQESFEAATAVARLDGTVSSIGVYAGEESLTLPTAGGFYQRRLVTSLCPGGSIRLARLFDVLQFGNVDLTCLFTHRMSMADVLGAYEAFARRQDGVVKIALLP